MYYKIPLLFAVLGAAHTSAALGSSPIRMPSSSFKITANCSYFNGTSKHESYDHEGIVKTFKAMPHQISNIAFDDSSNQHHLFAICFHRPQFGPTALYFFTDTKYKGTWQKPIDISHATQIEVRLASHHDQVCRLSLTNDTASDEDWQVVKSVSGGMPPKPTVAPSNHSLLLTATSATTNAKLSHGMLFNKPELYTLPTGFDKIKTLHFENPRNATYRLYLCATDPRAPVFSIKTSASKFTTSVEHLRDIKAIDIVPEPTEASRKPCFGRRPRVGGDADLKNVPEQVYGF